MTARRRSLAAVTALAMTTTVLVATADPVSAATLTVSNCADSGSGSLRAAVAGASPGDTIVFALAPACPLITLTSGDIGIVHDVTITGPGAANLAISGNNASRIFTTLGGTVVAISGLTLQGGNGNGTNEGGAIYNQGALTLTASTISGNTATKGGGIFNIGPSATIAVVNSTVTGNTATGLVGGGGIANQSGSVAVTNSTVSANIATRAGEFVFGGGIHNDGSLTVTNSALTGNSANGGGGIYSAGGAVALSGSTLTSNNAYGGGGIYNLTGSLTVTDSTLTSNGAVDGGGIQVRSGSVTTVTRSTLNANGALSGGAIENYGGSITVTASTITGNHADNLGGVAENGGSLTLLGSTLSGNTAGLAGNGFYGHGSVSAGGSIFATSDCDTVVFTDLGDNVDSGHSCVTSTVNGSLIDTPSGLDPAGLASNGGPTQTIALVDGSAAVGLVPNQTTGACPRTDQRGVASVANEPCDAGAYQTEQPVVLSDVVGWGANARGQLGDGTTNPSASPRRLAGTDWVDVSSEFETSAGIKADGTLWAWGRNDEGQAGGGPGPNVVSPRQIGTDTNWAHVTAGQLGSVALTRDGSLWAWGNLYYHGGLAVSYASPTLVDTNFAEISAGVHFLAGIKKDGSLWAWGEDALFGFNFDYGIAPTRIGTANDWASVSAGAEHAVARKTDGSIWAWGNDGFGQQGDGVIRDNADPDPSRIGSANDWASVIAGAYHTVGVKTDGSMWAWGYNAFGQLGDGSTVTRLSPVRVGSATDWSAAAADYHTVAVKTDGSLWAWGRNADGQLADGTTTNATSPQRIGSDRFYSDPEAGNGNTFALQAPVLTVTGQPGPLQHAGGSGGIDTAGVAADRIPLPLVDVGGTPIKRIDLGATGLAASPLAEIALADIPIKRIPLSSLPTTVGGGWAELLKDTSLTGVPLQSVTLDQVQALPLPVPPELPPPGLVLARALTLRDVDISASPIKRISLASLALGSAPIKRIALNPALAEPSDSSGDAARFDAWCGSGGLLPGLGFSCASQAVDGQSPLLSIDLAGIPIKRIPIKRIPIKRILLENAPIKRIPIKRIDLSVSPIKRIPIKRIATSASPIKRIPIKRIATSASPIKRIPIKRIATSASPIKRIEIGALSPASRSAVVDCGGAFNCDAPGATVEDASNADAVRAAAQLADLAPDSVLDGFTLEDLASGSALDGSTLGDLAPDSLLDGYTLEDLTDGIDDSWSLADVLVGLAARASLPWEDAGLTDLGLEALDPAAAGTVTEQANFRLLADRPAGPTTLSATLGGDLRYVDGSAMMSGPKSFPSGAVPAVQSGQVVTFPNLPTNAPAGAYQLTFDVRSGLGAGSFPVTVTVGPVAAGIGTTTAASTPVSVVDSAEPGNDTSPVGIVPDRLVVGHLGDGGSPSDVDLYTMLVPPVPGTVTTITLSHLAADGDLAAFPSLASPPLRSSGFRGIGLQSPPPETTDPDLRTSAPGGQPQDTQGVPRYNAREPIAVSAQRGTATEEIRLVSRGEGGSYTVQVSAYNGSASPDPYLVFVRQETSPGGGVCSVSTPPTVHSALPGGLPTGTETLFLVNAARLTAASPADSATVLADLAAVAADPKIKGVVVPVDGSSTVEAAYANWDSNACSVDAANEVVNRINDVVDGLAPAGSLERATLRSVVVVGGDDQIPMARVPDGTTKSNESSYAGDVQTADVVGVPATPNPLSAALANHNILTDDPYGDFDPIAWKDRALYVPDVALGRLVESGAQIAAQLEAYLAPQTAGRLHPMSSLTAGYDFLSDASTAIDAAIGVAVGGRVNGFARDTLVNDGWDKATLLDKLLPTGSAPGITSLNAHFDHHQALPAAGNTEGDTSDLVTTADLAGVPGKLAGDLLFSLGCHSGLAFPDTYAGITAGDSALDWPQALGAQGALYIANTGFGYGDSAAVALSERLMKLYAQHLDGTASAGRALTLAKQEYFAGLAAFSDYDAKILMESTFYGIPNYEVGAPVTPPAPPAPLPVEVPTTGLPFTPVDLSNIAFTPVNAPDGTSYLTTAGLDPQVTPGQPIQPRTEVDVTQPDRLAHGAIITDLSSTDISVTDATFASPTVDDAATEPVTTATDAAFPSTLQSISTYNTDTGPRQRLNIIPGQFLSSGDPSRPAAGIQRRFNSISARVLYGPVFGTVADTDFTAPQVANVTADATTAHVDFDLTAADDGGTVVRALVLYLDGSTWRSLDLTQAGGHWTGTGPATNNIVDYFVQVVDASGNVATASNKATNYTSDPPNTTPTVSGGADAPVYSGAEFVQAGSFTDADNGPWTAMVDYGRPGDATVPLALDGHTFTLRATYPNVGTYDVTVRVCDAKGACATDVVAVEQRPNATPTVSGGADAAIDSGVPFVRAGSFTDPDNGPWNATVDYGRPGDAPVPLRLDGNAFSLSATYPNAGTFNITVRVCDAGNACATDVVAVQQRPNTTPTVSGGADATIAAGNEFVRAGSFADPDNGPWTATVDYGRAGVAPVPLTLVGNTFSLSATYPNAGTFDVTVRVCDAGNACGTDVVTVTVNPVNAVSVGDASVLEGDSGTRVMKFPVTLPEPATASVTVHYAVTSGGAGAIGASKPAAGVDFKTASGTLTFKPSLATGKTPVVQYVTVTVYGDTTPEIDESVRVTLSSPSTGYAVGRAVGTGTMLTDDTGAGIKLGIGDVSVVEGKSGTGRNLVFPVTLSLPASSAVSARFVVAGVSATYGKTATAVSDFGGLTTGTVKFPLLASGKTGVTKTISIPIWADARSELTETFTITLDTPSGPITITRSVGTGTIFNDD